MARITITIEDAEGSPLITSDPPFEDLQRKIMTVGYRATIAESLACLAWAAMAGSILEMGEMLHDVEASRAAPEEPKEKA